jgi:hypothetical protein
MPTMRRDKDASKVDRNSFSGAEPGWGEARSASLSLVSSGGVSA